MKRAGVIALVVVLCLAAIVAVLIPIAPKKGFMLVESSQLPDRIGYRGRTYENGGERTCADDPPRLEREPSSEITVLIGRNIPVWPVHDVTSIPTGIYAEIEPGCFMGYGLLGGP